ncbi:NAD(P)-dependent oxidoreductase [Capsulimonas corticalis]|nr:NAD(P)-dependent oxidoreductase [Capsulimonas corticalis]
MSIYFFETDQQQQTYLTERLPDETLNFCSEPLKTAAQARDMFDAEIISPFVHSHVSADVLDALPSLKMIATRSTGFDHINAPCAESRGIPVCNVPTYGENTVAEHTFALILALSRNLHKAYMQTSAGNFSLTGLQGFDLQGKILGVVGLGGVGRYVAQIARGFGMIVLACDPVEDSEKAERFGYTYTTLPDLLGRSDIVTLHAPLTSETRGMIGSENLSLFKRGAFLINTARGELVDTEALVRALDDGILRGAGLDVIAGEEVFSEERQLLLNPNATAGSLKTALTNLSLLRRPDLIITPHIAFDSLEAIERLMITTVANIQAFRRGSPQNVVHG